MGVQATRPHLGRRLPSAPILYIYTREINIFMFFSTKHKKIILIICSFKAENVLLPCYSFPAKKSLKKSFILYVVGLQRLTHLEEKFLKNFFQKHLARNEKVSTFALANQK